ncbi:putative methyltransferase [Ranunculus cassubicifolius]
MGFGMGLNLLLLLAMVATNILSLYHLSSSLVSKPQPPSSSSSTPIPDHLHHQLSTIRATISHLTNLRTTTPTTTTSTPSSSLPSDLLLYAHLSPIASSCRDHSDLLHRYMTYTPYTLCPLDNDIAEALILRGCHPLPRRRCFSQTPLKQRFDMKVESLKFMTFKSDLDLPIPQLLQIAKTASSVIRLAMDVGAGTGTFAAKMKLQNVTVLSTTMNLGAPYNEVIALRGLVPLHVPLQQRFPIFDGIVDLVRCSHAVNRWIPIKAMEFLFYDVDRVLRGGGYLWLDHFFSKGVDLEKVYAPLIGKLGYKKVKWATGNKTDSSGLKNGEVYLTALLQKPIVK